MKGGSFMSATYHALVEQMLSTVLVQEGLELVDVEYVQEAGNWFLRVLIDRESGIDLEICSRVSEVLSEQLDAKDPIPNAYMLEVCSPGAERPLKKPRDFEKALNKYVYVGAYAPVNGIKELEGTLTHYDGESLTVVSGKQTWTVALSSVAQARLAIQF
jgi:ribosome maturation factor RimP